MGEGNLSVSLAVERTRDLLMEDWQVLPSATRGQGMGEGHAEWRWSEFHPPPETLDGRHVKKYESSLAGLKTSPRKLHRGGRKIRAFHSAGQMFDEMRV